MSSHSQSPRLAPLPRSGGPLPWRVTAKVLTRFGYACASCDLPLLADDEREVVRIDPAGGDDIDNLALLCTRCARAHRDHPQPLTPSHERWQPLD